MLTALQHRSSISKYKGLSGAGVGTSKEDEDEGKQGKGWCEATTVYK
jgi:hypothetical protein